MRGKEGATFHGGPSQMMHWIYTNTTEGFIQDAEVQADDGDAVCAGVEMYDANKGLILVAGGAPNHHYWLSSSHLPTSRHREESTKNAFQLTFGKPGDKWKPNSCPR
jgi:galactose oxidase